MELWEFFVSNFDEVLSLTGEHLWMSLYQSQLQQPLASRQAL